MFGFLKDKLKQAVKKFSKSAEEEVVEQKVDDAAAIERAKEQERAAAPKKAPAKEEKPKAAVPKPAPVKAPAAVPVKDAPVKPAPVAKPSAAPVSPKPIPKAEPAKAEPVRAPAPKAVPVKESKPAAPAKKEAPAPPKAKEVPKTSSPTPVAAPAKAIPTPSPEPPVQQAAVADAKDEKKPGFFGRLFSKRAEAVVEEVREVEREVEEAIEERRTEKELERAQEAVQEEAEDLHKREAEEAIAHLEEEQAQEEELEEEDAEQLPRPAPVPARERAKATHVAEPEEPSGFFGKLKDAFTKKTLSEEKFDELFWELEVAMLENNVALEVIEKIKQDLKDELTSGKVSRLGVDDMIAQRLRQSIEELFNVESFDLVERIKAAPKPFKLCIIGVNGSGKTTSLAKLVHLFQKNDLSVVVAASDTFRAAAIDQLREHTDRLNVKLIAQGYGADPAAVAFDAIEHAKAKAVDVVLIDTAGRLHSNTNLMAELEKVVRVAKPDLKIFVGEAITGNDCVEQAKVFDKLVGIDAIILAKADIDEKGGAAISVSYVTGKPILYLGTGQTYDDLEEFDREKVIEAVGL